VGSPRWSFIAHLLLNKGYRAGEQGAPLQYASQMSGPSKTRDVPGWVGLVIACISLIVGAAALKAFLVPPPYSYHALARCAA
jgi:hypothetical protein